MPFGGVVANACGQLLLVAHIIHWAKLATEESLGFVVNLEERAHGGKCGRNPVEFKTWISMAEEMAALRERWMGCSAEAVRLAWPEPPVMAQEESASTG